MKYSPSALLSLIRQFFSDGERKIVTHRHDATIWRIAPAREKPIDNTTGSDDIDFIRIYPAKRRR